MGSSLSPLDFLIGPGTKNPAPAASAAQGPQTTPAQGTAPASPLAALPGYNDALAQQTSGFIQNNLGKAKSEERKQKKINEERKIRKREEVGRCGR